MNCNKCRTADTKVIESRDVAEGDAIRRRRECNQCHDRFTTYERLEKPQLVVIKNNGLRELFRREKLLSGLYRACEKTPVTSLQLEHLATRVEQQLYGVGENEITTNNIGQIVMDELGELNEVAYVRFASVYRGFKDIASFERELSQIKELKADKIALQGV